MLLKLSDNISTVSACCVPCRVLDINYFHESCYHRLLISLRLKFHIVIESTYNFKNWMKMWKFNTVCTETVSLFFVADFKTIFFNSNDVSKSYSSSHLNRVKCWWYLWLNLHMLLCLCHISCFSYCDIVIIVTNLIIFCMQHIDAAYCYRCLDVIWSVWCWSWCRALQNQLNWSRCCLGAYVPGSKDPLVDVGPDSPWEGDILGTYSTPLGHF